MKVTNFHGSVRSVHHTYHPGRFLYLRFWGSSLLTPHSHHLWHVYRYYYTTKNHGTYTWYKLTEYIPVDRVMDEHTRHWTFILFAGRPPSKLWWSRSSCKSHESYSPLNIPYRQDQWLDFKMEFTFNLRRDVSVIRAIFLSPSPCSPDPAEIYFIKNWLTHFS